MSVKWSYRDRVGLMHQIGNSDTSGSDGCPDRRNGPRLASWGASWWNWLPLPRLLNAFFLLISSTSYNHGVCNLVGYTFILAYPSLSTSATCLRLSSFRSGVRCLRLSVLPVLLFSVCCLSFCFSLLFLFFLFFPLPVFLFSHTHSPALSSHWNCLSEGYTSQEDPSILVSRWSQVPPTC